MKTTERHYRRILIANRGEIACRIARGAHAVGYETVAVFSDADEGARHTRVSDFTYRLGPAPPAESYMNIERLLAAARATGADAVHPGYGFLAESAEFAAACREDGLVFIGPSAEAIRSMGSKRHAKLRMKEAGVPVVPGHSGPEQSVEQLAGHARAIGAPLMVKASAGGGGRGLRRLDTLATLARDLAAARREAERVFGDGELILERAIPSPRHVEIQIFADQHGHVVHMSERDCSVQRRHQKVIEEAPSPRVNAELRRRMGAAAIAAARAIRYEGAGTVEFLLDKDGNFYFMEMNTRLQVEHPVTELVTGVDLLAWQLDVAAGHPLPIASDFLPTGYAMEARLYAEDPDDDFTPQVGRARRIAWPSVSGVRVDHGLDEGQPITPFYDPLLAKIIAAGRTREHARRRLLRALSATRIAGVVTNRTFLIRILEHPEFASGGVSTDFIPNNYASLRAPPAGDRVWALAAVALLGAVGPDAWWSTGSARSLVRLSRGDATRLITLEVTGARVIATWDDIRVDLDTVELSEDAIAFDEHGTRHRFDLHREGDHVSLWWGTEFHRFRRCPVSLESPRRSGPPCVVAPMAGRVVSVRTTEGARVDEGDILVVVEAMKMQIELSAQTSGRVETLCVTEGDQVRVRQVLVELTEEA